MSVENRLREVILRNLWFRSAPEITMETNFERDLGADSLDQIDGIMAAEEEFNIEIPDDDAVKLKTFGDAVEYVIKRMEGR